MKNALFVLFTAAAVLFAGCEQQLDQTSPVSPADGAVTLSKAGTGYSFVNIFSTGGLLTTKSPLGYNPQLLNTPIELWMGVGNEVAGTRVGHVTFTPTHVVFNLTDADGNGTPDMFPFVLTQIHIQFADQMSEFPVTRQGNPIPGQFEYNVVPDPYATTISIPVTGFKRFCAIHVVVQQYGGIEGFNFYLPNGSVQIQVQDGPSAGDPSYWRFKVLNGGFISTYDMGYGPGVYGGYCIDVDHTLSAGTTYTGQLYSSYETLPSWMTGPGYLEGYQNLDKVNYLINNFAVGQLVQPANADGTPRINGGTGLPYPPEALTYSDIQRAIWQLVDDQQSTAGLTGWSQYRVNAILAAVNLNGEGFVPSCNQKIVFIVVPNTGTTVRYQLIIGQPIIGQIPVLCEPMGGTAWADGKYGANFPGAKQWATYFGVGLQ